MRGIFVEDVSRVGGFVLPEPYVLHHVSVGDTRGHLNDPVCVCGGGGGGGV